MTGWFGFNVGLGGAALSALLGAPDFTAGLAGPRDLAISGILLCLPVIAITFAGVSLQQGTGSTDLVGILAAILPPLVVPLAVESTSRRRGYPPRLLPIWLWLSGALVSLWLTALHNPLALLAGLVASGLAALAWHLRLLKMS